MMDTCCTHAWCFGGYFCGPCAAYYTRYRILGDTLKGYSCCQGYNNCQPCFTAGRCGEKDCPQLCLCLESFCCLGCSVSTSRIYMMDKYDLMSDPCDNRMIRFINCMSCISCICDVIAMFDSSFENCADLCRLIVECMYHCAIGCMVAQVLHEVDVRNDPSMKYAVATPLMDDYRDPYAGRSYQNR